MARISEIVLQDLAVAYDGPVNVKELLVVMKKWCARYDYDIEEKLHSTTAANGRDVTIKWTCDRKPDDYHKYFIKMKLEVKGGKDAVVDGEKVTESALKVKWDAELEHDYEDRWQRPTQRFLRALYDRFVLEEKEAKIIRRLKDDTKSFMGEVKRYLNVR